MTDIHSNPKQIPEGTDAETDLSHMEASCMRDVAKYFSEPFHN